LGLPLTLFIHGLFFVFLGDDHGLRGAYGRRLFTIYPFFLEKAAAWPTSASAHRQSAPNTAVQARGGFREVGEPLWCVWRARRFKFRRLSVF